LKEKFLKMSLIRHRFFPRTIIDDPWFFPSLDIFDPFDEFEHRLFERHLEWLKKPSFFHATPVRVPRTYRIEVDCAGYDPKSIKTEVKDGKLYVSGKEERKDKNGDYSSKEFGRSYDLPKSSETDKLVSFATRNGQLVVDVPLKAEKSVSFQDDLFPRIEGNQVIMKCSIPNNIDPSKLNVTIRDNDLIIQAEDINDTSDGYSRKTYYKRCTMPRSCDFQSMKCHYSNGSLSIEAPVTSVEIDRHIPIEFK
jgi:HSP20 family molecular chaperone IbpA